MLKSGAIAVNFTSELWTLPRIGMLIERRFRVQFAQSSVLPQLQELGWSVRPPTRLARWRVEAVIRTCKQQMWPTVKESQCDTGE